MREIAFNGNPGGFTASPFAFAVNRVALLIGFSLLPVSTVVPISNPFFANIRRYSALKLKLRLALLAFQKRLLSSPFVCVVHFCSFVACLALNHLVHTVSGRANGSVVIKNYQDFPKLCEILTTMKSRLSFPVTYCEVP